MTTLEGIAAWASSLSATDVPERVVALCRAQRRSVLAAMAASARDDASRRVLGAVSASAGDGVAPLVGTDRLARVDDALYAATALSIALDFDDYLSFAHTGHTAVLVATGVAGPLDVLDHPQGFLDAFCDAPLRGLLGGLGEGWATTTLCVKRYPGCAYIDTLVDALLELGPPPADEVAAIEIRAG